MPNSNERTQIVFEPIEGRLLLCDTPLTALGDVSGVVFLDVNHNGLREAGEQPLANWTVYSDLNGDGQLTAPTVLSSSQSHKVDCRRLNSTINVGQGGLVTDVNVTLQISNSKMAYVTAWLISPSGTKIQLFSNVGNKRNFVNTTLDDNADAKITSGSGTYTGQFRPLAALSGLNGQNMKGDWTLLLEDSQSHSDGTQLSWTLSLNGEPWTQTGADGSYKLHNLISGSQTIREVLQDGYFATVPSSGARTVTVTAGQTVSGKNFGDDFVIVTPPENHRPVANSQSATLDQGHTQVFTLTGSDIETPAGQLVYSIATGPAHGTISIQGNLATYTPNAGFFGADGFTFIVTDGGGLSSDPVGVVAITINKVTPVNQKPVANPQSGTLDQGQAKTFTLSGSDAETPAGLLVYSIVSGPAHGTLSLQGNLAAYTPQAGYFGPDAFNFIVIDGGGLSSDAAGVSITVDKVTPPNQKPVANPQSGSLDQDQSRTFILAGFDAETPSDLLVYGILTSPVHGSLVVAENNVITYTPDAGYFGSDSFSFRVTDAGGLSSDPAQVSITVNEVAKIIPENQKPTADDQSATVDEGQSITFALAGFDAETPSALLVYSVVTSPSHGTLTLQGNLATYTPYLGFSGDDSFSFTVTDSGLGTAGPMTSDAADVSITVNKIAPVLPPENLQPTADDQAGIVNDGESITFALSGSDAETPSSLLVYSIVTSPLHGTLTLEGNLATYTPYLGYAGSDIFSFTVTDGGVGVTGPMTSEPADVTITVNGLQADPGNQPPVAYDQTGSLDTNTSRGFFLSGSDAETASGLLKYRITSAPLHGSVVLKGNQAIYTPVKDYVGPDSFEFIVTDTGTQGQGPLDSAPATMDITVDPIYNYTRVGTGGLKKFKFIDDSGDMITISVTGGGWANVNVTNNQTFNLAHGDMQRILVDGTTLKTKLKIAIKGKNATSSLGVLLDVENSIGQINAPKVNLLGNVDVHGSLRGAAFHDNLGSNTFQVDQADPKGKGLKLKFAQVQDLVVQSAMPLTSFSALQWVDLAVGQDAIAAPSIGKLNIRGNFNADLNLGGSAAMSLKSAKIGGSVTDGQWAIGGGVGSLSIRGSLVSSTVRTGGSINKVALGASTGSDFLAGIDPASVRFASDSLGHSPFVNPAATIKAFAVKGLKGAAVGQRFFNDSNISAANMGSVKLLNGELATDGIYASSEGVLKSITYTDKADPSASWTWPQDNTVGAAVDLIHLV